MTDLINTNSHIAIVVNPLSGKGKAVKTGRWLSVQLNIRKIKHSLFSRAWPAHFEDFTEVWIVGGDGTNNHFINRYKNINLPLAFFKGGTGNDFAWKLYGDMSLEEQLKRVLEAKAKPVDAAICNGRLYVNGLGIGFDGEVMQSMGQIRWMGGHLGYLWAVIKKIFYFKEPCFKIEFNNKIVTGKFLLVIVNNSSRTGGGFLVAPGASIDDGKLDMILCKPLSLFKRLRYLPVIEKGKHLNLSFIDYSSPGEVRIEAEKELPAQMDGEFMSSKVFEIRVLPGNLLVRY